ncbi:magnesium chelatase subunit H [Acuticoccus sp. MNP-M23]|uniref:magnesium chelatase subunit H n=1 Tax=Acuticoccus sp. MNP-M23 TaxID=3072793 RepID=UPI002814F085|nr:magnesium chelatase subunit H [Acuticoccus sp. MNP-M23]WMS42701.1 magnesium chelatase subunit H [Acuticoccus sp. MNP-M23]
MLKLTSAANATPVRVAIVTLDNHLARTVSRAEERLRASIPGLEVSFHAAGAWQDNPRLLDAAKRDVANADIIIATMLFLDEHISAILPAIEARRADCDAVISFMCAGEVIRQTRIGKFEMGGQQSAAIRMLKKLRGSDKPNKSSGAKQLKMLRRLPRMLRFIPGTAQDVRAYFIGMQYWLAGSEENITGMMTHFISRYAAGPRASLRDALDAKPPVEYPDVGLYHPRVAGTISADVAAVRAASRAPARKSAVPASGETCLTDHNGGKAGAYAIPARARELAKGGTVGLLLMRAYVLSGDHGHYDGMIAELEAQGLTVVPAFAAGLDNRPAIDAYFRDADGKPTVDAIVSLTGFSLVGGPAYNDTEAAAEVLGEMGVPYMVCQPLEFQSVQDWSANAQGYLPVEATMMVAIPELDGATNPQVFGGRCTDCNEMVIHRERASRLAGRVSRMIALGRSERADRKIAAVLFNFPPNAGATGTAAFLSVFESLFNTLHAMAAEGYTVELPASVDALREKVIHGNAAKFGAEANVGHRIAVDDHVASEPYLDEIEAVWGPAPGKHQTDGATIHVYGAQFGNVFVGVQPAFGYEGDPMRLLFEGGFAPTHAFSAFYRHLGENFDAVLHFGTHGALEFMPGKQVGLSGECWPDRLIGSLPNINIYAANNPSEGMLAKRRGAATLVSHLTPAITEAGLYRGLTDLKASLDHWRRLPTAERTDMLADTLQAQAAALDLAPADPPWAYPEAEINGLVARLHEYETALIPDGLHVIGAPMAEAGRAGLLAAMANANHGGDWLAAATAIAAEDVNPVQARTAGPKAIPHAGMPYPDAMLEEDGKPAVDREAVLEQLVAVDAMLRHPAEMTGIITALDGRFVAPGPAGDLIRKPEMLPTGRNIHGFDPFRIPSAFALADGSAQAIRILDRQYEETGDWPETIALVLWGTDNLKSEGAPIAQALALMGAKPRYDSYGRIAGAALIPLERLGRPRVDVMLTLSGIFRDLLPLQMRLLAEAALLAATADEPLEENAIRRHSLAYAAEHGCDMETAALRVFSNAEGAYGANVNQLVTSSQWEDENELAEMFTSRKGFAYGVKGKPSARPELLQSVLKNVSAAHQNLESVELGVTTVDHYFDSLGGISRAVTRAKGSPVPVYISDQTHGDAKVRTLDEQVALETRTRALNPKWTEGMLKHGYEGVRQIEASITNTMGWSATVGGIQPWVYERLTETYMLDEDMRDRLTKLNPAAAQKVATRLLEASERKYWQPDEATLAALEAAADEIEDRLEGVAA